MMSESGLLLPGNRRGQDFYVEASPVIPVYDALSECLKAGFKAAFMPELANLIIEAPEDSVLALDLYTTLSIKVTGTTSRGASVVVYAHCPTGFSHPGGLAAAVLNRLVLGAGVMPQNSFQELVEHDGEMDDTNTIQLVWVVDHEALEKAHGGIMSLEEALRHPQTGPFIGSQKRAEDLFARLERDYGNQIRVEYRNDLWRQPLGRLLASGFKEGVYTLDGDYPLFGSARYFGLQSQA